ncbi:MAG: YaiO family outer membrane beta-barrel protein [Gemmatimonadaceae bacterium]
MSWPVVRVAAQGTQGAASSHESVRPLDDRRRLGVRYQYDDLSDIEPWHDLALEYAQRLPFGTLVLGVSGARRYLKNGVQFELQAYPRLTRRSYVFLDVAASSSTGVFLPLRLVAEPYFNFATGWEVSAGVRYLRTPGPDAYTYTGTLGKYFGNYWISVRPSFTRVPDNNSYAWGLTGRRYFGDRYDYATLTASRSVGVDPEARDPAAFTRIPRLISYAVALDRRQPLGRSGTRATYGIGYQQEQIAPGRTRLHRSATVGLEWYVP